MTDDEICARLNAIFRDVFENETLTVTAATSAKDIAPWDSFNHINILVASEMRFGVRFTSAEVETLNNVGDFVRLIQEKL